MLLGLDPIRRQQPTYPQLLRYLSYAENVVKNALAPVLPVFH